MKKIEILDCTLRDGGYINNWNFGLRNIEYIIKNLSSANIEYIECGFINNINNDKYNSNKTIFNDIKEAELLIKDTYNSKFTLMMTIDNYNIEKLPKFDQNKIKIIRLAFHKNDLKKAIYYAKQIKEKGYDLFLQPTTIMGYSEIEIIELLKLCNNTIKPDGIAIVDTLGEMNNIDVEIITKLFDKYLNNEIKILFHAHNALQMAYSNAIVFINNIKKNRNIIIDTTLMGIGRNSGNVCTELMTHYINNNYGGIYNHNTILQIIDEIMFKLKRNYEWGYSPEYMLNAKNKAHPNYSTFFKQRIKNIKLNELNTLLNIIPLKYRNNFDEKIANNVLNEFYDRRK